MERFLKEEIRNCRWCGRVFVSRGSSVCSNCFAKEEDMFQDIKKYLKKNPGQNASQVAAGTNLPLEVVIDFVSRGRLLRSEREKNHSVCRICRKPIPSGKICASCEALLNQISKASSAKSTQR
jgi:hypothetical protein